MTNIVANKQIIEVLGNPLALMGNAMINMGKAVSNFFKRERMIAELSQMSDWELQDIGLNRSDITHVVNQSIK